MIVKIAARGTALLWLLLCTSTIQTARCSLLFAKGLLELSRKLFVVEGSS
jgi:hypothetical protein